MSLLLIAQIANRASEAWEPGEIESAVSRVVSAAIVAFLVYRVVRRVPWPRPFRLGFALLNVVAAFATGLLWLGLSVLFEGLLAGNLLEARALYFWKEVLVMGVFLYAVVAGITYPVEATARAAHAEAVAARTQLAALRAQIHPHFLFNALHTVVQLIPTDPARASEAAELVASLLRATVEEERSEVTLGDEWDFVSRYLELERIRFGDRLRVRSEIGPDLLDEKLPSFALQTLVENAVRHGAAPRVAPTEILITATGTASELTLTVKNTGDPRSTEYPVPSTEYGNTSTEYPVPSTETGTGLSRLREQLSVLYGDAARVTHGAVETGGFEAVVVVPRSVQQNPRHDAPSRSSRGGVSSENL